MDNIHKLSNKNKKERLCLNSINYFYKKNKSKILLLNEYYLFKISKKRIYIEIFKKCQFW